MAFECQDGQTWEKNWSRKTAALETWQNPATKYSQTRILCTLAFSKKSKRNFLRMFSECTPHKEICSRARWKDETKGQEVVVQKALDGTYTLCLTLFVFFISISYVCIFLPTEERVVTERRKSQCMNVMGTETSNGVTFQLRAFHSSPSEDSPVLCCQDGWMDYIMIVW